MGESVGDTRKSLLFCNDSWKSASDVWMNIQNVHSVVRRWVKSSFQSGRFCESTKDFIKYLGDFDKIKSIFFNHSSIFTFNLPSIIHKSSADIQNLETTIPLLTSFYAWYPVLICVLFKSVINEICSNNLFL